MKRWIALLLACLSLGLVVAACGDDDDDSGGGEAATTEQPAEEGGTDTSESGGGEAEAGGGVEVSMKNIMFDPPEIEVEAGETITFRNDEGVPHDVAKTSGPGPEFSSGPEGGMNEGDTYELTLDQPGTYEYVCRVHAPGMAGTIVVK